MKYAQCPICNKEHKIPQERPLCVKCRVLIIGSES